MMRHVRQPRQLILGLVALAWPVAAGPIAADRSATPPDAVAAATTSRAARRWTGIDYPTVSGSPAKSHIRETLGQGACWTDFDADGDLDLFVVNGARETRGTYRAGDGTLVPWRLYENRDGIFADVAEEVGAVADVWGIGCAAGDVNADGRDDLFVTAAAGPNVLLIGTRARRFTRTPIGEGRAPGTVSTGAAFADLDGDGDLDLVVANYLDEQTTLPAATCRWKGIPVMCGPKGYRPLDAHVYVNDAGRLRLAPHAGLAGHATHGLGVVVFDADGDRDLDLFVAGDSSPSRLFVNRGDGRFDERGLAAGIATGVAGNLQAGMGVDAGDLDGDGRPDLVKTNFSDDVPNFFRNDGRNVFTDWVFRSGLSVGSRRYLGWAVLLEDFDLDGDLDVLMVNGHVYPQVDAHPGTGSTYRQRMQLFLNDGTGRFADVTSAQGGAFAQPMAGRSAAAADIDRDGDADLVITRDGEPPLLLLNTWPARDARWLGVRLAGRGGNREGIGARIVLETSSGRQVREMRRSRGYLSSGEAAVAFGMPSSSSARRLRVDWPSGAQTTLESLSLNRYVVIEEPGPARSGTRRAERAGPE